MTSNVKASRWHHRPAHVFLPGSAYIVTSGTMHKEHFFNTDDKLRMLRESLFEVANKYFWNLQAWSLFANHYHFIATAPEDARSLRTMIQHLHSMTARRLNKLDNTAGRKVWFQYWDKCLTFENSYLARLNYVNNNPVHHKMTTIASDYPFCSAAWFETNSEASFRKKVESFKSDTITIEDDY